MHTLLIVDDEPIIVDGLYELMQDMKQPELDIYRAYTVTEAIDFVGRVKVDLVLSDICMPGMSGLELQTFVVEKWPRCKVIFLSGHNEFSYAQTALRNGAVDYLLKTERFERIYSAVEKAIGLIEQESNLEDIMSRSIHNMNLALPMLRKKFFDQILQGRAAPTGWLERNFSDLDIRLSAESPVLIALGRVDRWEDDVTAGDQSLLLYGVQNIAEEYLGGASNMLMVMKNRNYFYWLFQPNHQKTWEQLFTFVYGTASSIQSTCKKLLKMPVSLVVSSKPSSWNEFSNRFEVLQMLLLDGFSGEEEVLLNDLLAAESAENAFDVDLKATKQRLFMHAKLKLLETYLNRGKRDDFIEIYQQLFDDMKLLNGVYEKYVQYEILHAISSMLLSYMNQWGQTEEIHKNHELYRVNYNDISLNDIMMRFEKMALSLFSRKQAETYETTDRTVTLINNYIHSQLHGDLSLNKLAEVVYLNPSYLSRYYKQMTGIGISKYIEDTKIARAKEMLKQEQLKVHEIATQLGINSATNFTRFFKKATGLTPMEFRETSI